MSQKKCPGCGKRRKLIPITAQEARWFFESRPRLSVGAEFCFACIKNPPTGPPRDIVAELNHVAMLCRHAAQDLAKNPATNQIVISTALYLLRDIAQTVSRTP